MKKLNSDFTAVYKKDGETHILKAKIIDEHFLYFQCFNKTRNILLPVFEIPANYGVLPYNCFSKDNYIKELHQKIEDSFKLTKNINRNSLIGYFKTLELSYLINKYKTL